MPEAARLNDPTQHGKPLNPGIGSPDVTIGYMAAWRALPSGMGAGVEKASEAMKDLMGKPKLDVGSTPAKLAKVFANLMKDAPKAASKGAPAAPATTGSGFSTLVTANVALTATYTAAAAVPGGEPAAAQAYTEGIKAAAATFASASMAAIAGVTDTHICPIPCPIPPHGPGVVTKGSKSVFINNLPAARKDDKVFEACGGPDPIQMGCSSVLIGDDGGGPGGGGGAGAGADEAAPDKQQEEESQAQSSEAALVEAATAGIALVQVCEQCAKIQTAASPDPLTARVRFRLVDDDTGAPLSNVAMRIRLPDGSTEQYTTDQDGEVEIEDIEEVGGTVDLVEVRDERGLEVRRMESRPL